MVGTCMNFISKMPLESQLMQIILKITVKSCSLVSGERQQYDQRELLFR